MGSPMSDRCSRRSRSFSGLTASFDRQPGSFPFGKTIFKAAGLKAPAAKVHDRLVGHEAIRSPAIRDDLTGCRQTVELAPQSRERDVYRARQMALREFLGRAHVDERCRSLFDAPH